LGQEFFLNSNNLQEKIRTLLPSQGGAGAGFDLSASTQIIPIVDLTETAEGSVLREDLQTSFSFNSVNAGTFFSTTATDVITSTGFYRVFGSITLANQAQGKIMLSDGTSTKLIAVYQNGGTGGDFAQYDFIVFLPAGHSLQVQTNNGTPPNCVFHLAFRQIATISGELVNPSGF